MTHRIAESHPNCPACGSTSCSCEVYRDFDIRPICPPGPSVLRWEATHVESDGAPDGWSAVLRTQLHVDLLRAIDDWHEEQAEEAEAREVACPRCRGEGHLVLWGVHRPDVDCGDCRGTGRYHAA